MTRADPFDTAPGSRTTVQLPLPALPNGAAMTLPVAVLRGADDGPTGWISAAVHGDEINGTGVIRRLLRTLAPENIAGTLLVLPIVDVYGFNAASRYLPDRRDLNRCFPGSLHGSLAGQVANMFFTEVVQRCDFGLDLHTGSDGRTNLPQVRGDITDPRFITMASAFSPPIIVASDVIDGSLRQQCAATGIDYLLYEAGEAGRFDADAIRIGYEGCLRVLVDRGLLDTAPGPGASSPLLADGSHWIRAPRSGIFDPDVGLGDPVHEGQSLGDVSDSFGERKTDVVAASASVVIGLAVDPLVEAGDALIHVATTTTTTLVR